jgi:hypothetical protein
VALPLKRRVLGLVEVFGHDFGHEALWVVDDEGTPVWLPTENGSVTFRFKFVKDSLKLKRETCLDTSSIVAVVVIGIAQNITSALTRLLFAIAKVLHPVKHHRGLLVVIVDCRSCLSPVDQSTGTTVGQLRSSSCGNPFTSLFTGSCIMLNVNVLMVCLLVNPLVHLEVFVARSMLSDHILNGNRRTCGKTEEIWLFIRIPSGTNAISVDFLALHTTAQKLHAPQKFLVIVAPLIVAHLRETIKAVQIELWKIIETKRW